MSETEDQVIQSVTQLDPSPNVGDHILTNR